MDIELARTFLEVLRCGNFIRAARELHITQTTVTARIQNLETQLGCRLLVRNRNGVEPTPHGERFVNYAKTMLQVWERAQHEVPMATTAQANLQIGGELSLWNPLLLDWLLWLRGGMPETSIRAGVDLPSSLVQKVLQNTLDIAVMYAPQYHPQLQVELLMQETLIMVSTDAKTGNADYVYIDWGPEFMSHHAQAFPELRHSPLSIGLGPLALQYILRAGGRGYFRARAVEPYIKSGQLHRVQNAPEFMHPIYMVLAAGRQEPYVLKAVQGLKETANKTDSAWTI